MSIVIPVFREEQLLQTIESIHNCDSPNESFELILLFNSAESDTESREYNQRSKIEVEEWIKQNSPAFPIHMVEENHLDDKLAGVGLARKIGMGEAARRLLSIGKEEAVILCLDADCTIDNNYLQAVEAHFQNPKSKAAASLYFEHPLEGDDYSNEIYEAILYYELHLRYYKHAMTYCGLPFDRYTVGSSMAVRVQAYLSEGGMNKRKAGEDFYFLQKYLIKGELDEINTTTVYPSPRKSDRVPFGTGRAVQDHLEERKDLQLSYSPKSFKLIAEFIGSIKRDFPRRPQIAEEIKGFFKADEWEVEWKKLIEQSRDLESFEKRFYQWFTPFKLLKLLHYLRDEYYPNISIEEAVSELLEVSGDVGDQLEELRRRDQF